MEPLPPLPPAPITPQWLALREELREFHEKLVALDVVLKKHPAPKNLAADVSACRGCRQRRKDFLRLELSFDNATPFFQEKLKEWMESQDKWLRDYQRTRDVVEAWVKQGHTSKVPTEPKEELTTQPDGATAEKLAALKKRIYDNPNGQTPRRDVATYYGVSEKTVGKWVTGKVKSRKLNAGPKRGMVSNQSIIQLDSHLKE